MKTAPVHHCLDTMKLHILFCSIAQLAVWYTLFYRLYNHFPERGFLKKKHTLGIGLYISIMVNLTISNRYPRVNEQVSHTKSTGGLCFMEFSSAISYLDSVLILTLPFSACRPVSLCLAAQMQDGCSTSSFTSGRKKKHGQKARGKQEGVVSMSVKYMFPETLSFCLIGHNSYLASPSCKRFWGRVF